MPLYEKIKKQEEAISLIGLGYVGMPIAIEFANRGVKVIGYDLNAKKNQYVLFFFFKHFYYVNFFLNLIRHIRGEIGQHFFCDWPVPASFFLKTANVNVKIY